MSVLLPLHTGVGESGHNDQSSSNVKQTPPPEKRLANNLLTLVVAHFKTDSSCALDLPLWINYAAVFHWGAAVISHSNNLQHFRDVTGNPSACMGWEVALQDLESSQWLAGGPQRSPEMIGSVFGVRARSGWQLITWLITFPFHYRVKVSGAHFARGTSARWCHIIIRWAFAHCADAHPKEGWLVIGDCHLKTCSTFQPVIKIATERK